MSMNVSVVILAWNGIAYLKGCIESLLEQTVPPAEILLVDNGSHDGSAAFVAANYPSVIRLENATNLGVSRGWNQGIQASRGDLVAVANQDLVFRPDWLHELLAVFVRRPQAAIVGCKLLYPDNCTLQHAGGQLTADTLIGSHYGYGERDLGQYDDEREVEFVTGAVMAIRRTTFDAVGLFDERFFPAYYEDVDFCFRARQMDRSVWYAPRPVAIHYESTSTGGNASERLFAMLHRGRLRFALKHLSDQAFSERFIPAEIALLHSDRPTYMLTPLRQLYAEGLPPDLVAANPRAATMLAQAMAATLDRMSAPPTPLEYTPL